MVDTATGGKQKELSSQTHLVLEPIWGKESPMMAMILKPFVSHATVISTDAVQT